jgi:hypothetical protein
MESMAAIGECLDRIGHKALEDAEFRAQLVEDPNGTFAQEFDGETPAGFTVEVHEDTDTTVHFVLPPEGALSAADLATIGAGERGGYNQSSAPGSRYGWNPPRYGGSGYR